MDALRTDRAEQDACERATTARPDDQQVIRVDSTDEHVGGDAFDELGFDLDTVVFWDGRRDGRLEKLLGGLTYLGEVEAIGGQPTTRAAREGKGLSGRPRRPNVNRTQRRSAQPRFFDSKAQSRTRFHGAVDADDDGALSRELKLVGHVFSSRTPLDVVSGAASTRRGSPRRRISARTTASLCSMSWAE
jgi:hypothetical protein